MKKYLIGSIALTILSIAFGFILWHPYITKANVTQNLANTVGKFMSFDFFASTSAQTYLPLAQVSTTTNATSTQITPYFDTNGNLDQGYFVIAGAKQVTFYFMRQANGVGNSGSSAFHVQVSPTASSSSATVNDWVDYYQLLPNGTASDARVGTSTISAATSTLIYNMDLSRGAYYAVRCIVVTTTDGLSSCYASASW